VCFVRLYRTKHTPPTLILSKVTWRKDFYGAGTSLACSNGLRLSADLKNSGRSQTSRTLLISW
jgi:hypothetical protein